MKFRMMTDAVTGKKIAVNIDWVRHVQERDNSTEVWMGGHGQDVIVIEVKEDFDTVLSRLNVIAE